MILVIFPEFCSIRSDVLVFKTKTSRPWVPKRQNRGISTRLTGPGANPCEPRSLIIGGNWFQSSICTKWSIHLAGNIFV